MKIGVVAHYHRIRQADRLIREIQADTVSVDRGSFGPKINHCRVWTKLMAITEPDEWCIVLEDDAKPCKNFRTEAGYALEQCGGNLASFYLGKQRPIHYQDRIFQAVASAVVEDASWIVGDAVLHGVAIAMRGNMIQGLLDYLMSGDKLDPIDEAVTAYARRKYVDCWYTFPSIVDHLDLPTLIAHPDGEPREPGRRAWHFNTREEWTSRKVAL